MSRAWDELISVDAERMGGQPVFKGTRVPVRSLFEHLNGGDGLEVFLEDFPGVTQEQAQAVLELAARGRLDDLPR